VNDEKIKSLEVKLTCTACGDQNHQWYEAYYSDCIQLKRAGKSLITRCNNVKEYVIVNIEL
jgi:hypothetical protein